MSIQNIKKILRNTIKWLRAICLIPVNVFYRPYLLSYFRKEIRKVSSDTQLFLLARRDFGTYLLHLNYISLWSKSRSNVAVVVLTPRFSEVIDLAASICPEVKFITPKGFIHRFLVKSFGVNNLTFETYAPIYALIHAEHPDAVFIYEQSLNWHALSSFVKYLDPIYSTYKNCVSSEFLKGYLAIRPLLDYRLNVFIDMINIHCETYTKRQLQVDGLGIKNPYIVMNLNCKDYKNSNINFRRINYPERYNVVIDSLIEKGFTVVLQGRNEQPYFQKRDGLIDYARSGNTTLQNDLKLYAHAVAAITSKTGAEIFSSVCDIPALGLNYTELFGMQPNLRFRYYPKHLKNAKGQYLTWSQLLSSKDFFQVADNPLTEGFEYEDLSSEEMLNSVDEFLELIAKPHKDWLIFTPKQEEFRKQLNPMHLDLYNIKSAPSDYYLSSSKSSLGRMTN